MVHFAEEKGFAAAFRSFIPIYTVILRRGRLLPKEAVKAAVAITTGVVMGRFTLAAGTAIAFAIKAITTLDARKTAEAIFEEITGVPAPTEEEIRTFKRGEVEKRARDAIEKARKEAGKTAEEFLPG